MKRAVVFSFVGAILIAVFAALFFIMQQTMDQHIVRDGRLIIGTSVFPLADIARNVGGESVRVIEIVPPGASPHSYTLTPQQVADLQQASVVFTIGAGLEGKLIQSIIEISKADLVEVSDGIELLPFERGDGRGGQGVDPHYWLSVPNARAIARTIAVHVARVDQTHADQYSKNLARYMSELEFLERELQEQANSIERKQFIAMHGAWAYFADQYGLELVASYEPVEGKEPSLADLQRLQNLVTQYDIRTFYTEPQKVSSAALQFLEHELGLNIGVLDPIGGVGDATSYVNLMRQNMQAIVEGSR